MNSSKLRGRLSRALGRRKPCSTSVIFLARSPAYWPRDLRHRDVRLVDDHEKVRREVVEQRERALAGLTPVEVRRVVLDARADAGLFEHLEVVFGARAQALGLEELALGLEQRQLLLELDLQSCRHARWSVARLVA